MPTAYERGYARGLRDAASLCEETAQELQMAAMECDREGDEETSGLVGVGEAYVRHTAARIRAAAQG